MRDKRPLLKVGDIVVTNRYKGGQLFKVNAVHNETWTAQQAHYSQCDKSDVGTQYTDRCDLEAVFFFNMPIKPKNRKKFLYNASTWYIKKIEPQHITEMIQKLDQFLADVWP